MNMVNKLAVQISPPIVINGSLNPPTFEKKKKKMEARKFIDLLDLLD